MPKKPTRPSSSLDVRKKILVAVGLGATTAAAVAAVMLFSTKQLDAQVDVVRDGLYETDLGYVNIRKFDLGDVLIRGSSGQYQRVGNIASKLSVIAETPPVAEMSLRMKSGLNLKLSLEVPQDVKSQLESVAMRSVELSLLNSKRRTLDRDAMAGYLNGPDFIAFLKNVHWNVQGLQQRVFVVSTVYNADELKVDLTNFNNSTGQSDSGKLKVGRYDVRMDISNVASLKMKGSGTAAIFEFMPYIWSPRDDSVRYNQNYPYW